MEDRHGTVFAGNGLLFLAMAAETVEKENISSSHSFCQSKNNQNTCQKQAEGYMCKSTTSSYADTNASISNPVDKTKPSSSYSGKHRYGHQSEPIIKPIHSSYTFKDKSILKSKIIHGDNANIETTSKRIYDCISNNVSNNSTFYGGTEIFSYNAPSLGICCQNNPITRKSPKYAPHTHILKCEQIVQRAPKGIHNRNDSAFAANENQRKTSKMPKSLTTHDSKNDDMPHSPEMLEALFLELKKQDNNLQRFICNARKTSLNHTFKVCDLVLKVVAKRIHLLD